MISIYVFTFILVLLSVMSEIYSLSVFLKGKCVFDESNKAFLDISFTILLYIPVSFYLVLSF
jgi:hypothetical protein